MREQRRKDGTGCRRGALMRWVAMLALAAGLPPAHAQTYTDTRTSRFSYYQPSDGAKNGLLQSETIEPNSPQLCVTTSYSYDPYGNKASATTANCGGATGQ
ncbi:hypothetical protein EXJ73_23545, partial [Pelomonas aquatica]